MARRVIGQSQTPSWLNNNWLRRKRVETGFPKTQTQAVENRGRRLAEQLRFALTGRLASLLRHDDRDSMCWSIESRVPFLTTELAEFMLRLPESYLLSPRGETKRVFRAAMRGLVPDAILERRDKIGFQTPEHDWLGAKDARTGKWINFMRAAQFLNQKESHKYFQKFSPRKKTRISRFGE